MARVPHRYCVWLEIAAQIYKKALGVFKDVAQNIIGAFAQSNRSVEREVEHQ